MGQIKTKFLTNNAVTNAKLAQMAANTAKANLTGSTANASDVSAVSTSTASSIAVRDSNKNFAANSVDQGVATTATGGGNTTLSVSSSPYQQFTGTSTQNLILPDATTLNSGRQFYVLNRSTGAVTIKDNGSNTLATVAAASFTFVTLISNGTANGTWDVSSAPSGNAITALTGDVTATGPGSVTATIASHAVSNAKFRQSAATSVVGNSTGSTADVADISASADGQVLRRSGGTLSWGIPRLITNSRGSPGSITASGGITAAAGVDEDQYIQGSGGAVTITANPQISAGTVDGQTLRLIGRSDTNTVTLSNGTGLIMNGSITLGADDIIVFRWDGTNWVEVSRNG